MHWEQEIGFRKKGFKPLIYAYASNAIFVQFHNLLVL